MKISAYRPLPGVEAPTEIQLWGPENPTDYGVHKWTARSVREAFGEYQRRGNPLQLDVEHMGEDPPKGDTPPPTAGYAHLELRNGLPWLVLHWSAYALEQIQTGQRRFLSPSYDVDKATGEIVKLYRVSLVGDPGTHHARMLASRRVRAKGERMDPKVATAAIEALTSGDGEKALEILKASIVSAVGGAPSEPAVEAASPDAPPPPAPPGAGPEDEEEPVEAGAAAPLAIAASAKKSEAKLEARLDAFERDAYLKEHGSRVPEATRRVLATMPLSTVKAILDASPAPAPAKERIAAATRGAGQGGPASSLPPSAKEEMDARMGLTRVVAGVKREGNCIKFGVLTSEDAQKIRASRAKKVG